MEILRLAPLYLAILTLAGCGSMSLENKRVDYKAVAVKVTALDIPPDLTAPAIEDHYIIPENSAIAANYSDFAKGNIAPQTKQASSVLPESPKVRLERSGSLRWLRVDDRAENLWPTIKAFWQDNGFVIKTDLPQAGIIETDWAENRAKIPKDGLRSILGKVLDGLYDSGERDMYRVRLERSNNGNSTEIYLTLYGKEEVLSEDKSSSRWQTRAHDADLENTMLQMLMAKLGGTGAELKAPEQKSLASGLTAAPKLQTLTNGNKIILLSDPFDRSWRTTGLVLEHEGYVIEDKDRTNGIYFLRIQEKPKEKSLSEKLAFWNTNESQKSARYQVTVHEINGECEISASTGNGDHNALTDKLIDALYKALGK